MTRTTPLRRISLHLSHIRRTLDRTFMAASGHFAGKKSEKLLYGSMQGRQDILAGHARGARGSGAAIANGRPPPRTQGAPRRRPWAKVGNPFGVAVGPGYPAGVTDPSPGSPK